MPGSISKSFATACAVAALAAPAAATESEEHEGGFHRHHLGILLGGASAREEYDSDQHGFVGGLDYEYRFTKWVGAGPIVEVAAGSFRDVVFVGSLFVHPWKGLVFAVGPGAEISSHGTKYMTRFGVGYQIPIASRVTVAPDLSVDLVGKEPVYVYGVAIGIGF